MMQAWLSLTQRRWAFWVCLVVVLALALLPTPSVPTTGWDKANHALAFAVLAILGCWSYPGRTARVLLALLGYGILIELLQALTSYRSGEVLDAVADGVGLLLGWQASLLLRVIEKPAGAASASAQPPPLDGPPPR